MGRREVVEIASWLGHTFYRGLRNLLCAGFVLGVLVGSMWAYGAMFVAWPMVGWIVSGILGILLIGAVWND